MLLTLFNYCVMVAVSAKYSRKKSKNNYIETINCPLLVNTIAFFSLEEFTNNISVVRTGLLRELVMPLFPFEYTGVFNFHHIATHFLPSVFLFVRIQWMRFWLEFYFSGQAFYPECCLSKPLLSTVSNFSVHNVKYFLEKIRQCQ